MLVLVLKQCQSYIAIAMIIDSIRGNHAKYALTLTQDITTFHANV